MVGSKSKKSLPFFPFLGDTNWNLVTLLFIFFSGSPKVQLYPHVHHSTQAPFLPGYFPSADEDDHCIPPGVLRPVLTLSSSPGALFLLSGCGVRVFLGVSVRRRPHPKFHFFFSSSSSFSAGASPSRLSSLSPFHCCPTEAGRTNGGKKRQN